MRVLIPTLIVLLFFSTAWATGEPITIRLHVPPAASEGLTVEVGWTGGENGETLLQLTEEWGGVQDPGRDVADLSVTAEERTAVLESVAPHQWRVRHAPGAALTTRYTIPPNQHQASEDHADRYRPFVNAELVHLIGELSFILPAWEDGTAVDVALEWVGLDARSWTAVSSFGPGPRREFSVPLRRLRSAVYLAGDLDLATRRVRDRPVQVAMAGDWDLDAAGFAELVARIVEMQRVFFDDFDRPYYLATLIPTGRYREGGFSLGGTGLTDSFATFLMPGTDLVLDDGSLEPELVKLLVHEFFHEWNGHVLGLEQPEVHGYWFSEGFTAFYTRRFATQGGWLTDREFVEELNAVIREHFASPFARHSFAELEAHFWGDHDAQRQPYLRGELIACLVDDAIRRRTEGKSSLDDLLLEMVDEARSLPKRHLAMSNADLFARIESWAGPEIARQIRGIVDEGDPVELPRDLYSPWLTSFMGESGAFDLGFALGASQEAHEVRGVVRGSAAWKAGLRDGLPLRGWSVRFGDADSPVSFQVEEDGELKTIEYLPRGNPVPVVQFAAAPGVEVLFGGAGLRGPAPKE